MLPFYTRGRRLAALCLACLALVALAACTDPASPSLPAASSSAVDPAAEKFTSETFAMDTIVTQTAYGPHAQAAMQQVNKALSEWEGEFSMFLADSDIGRINAAGPAGEEVSEVTAGLLQRALALGAKSEGAFAITIAPLTKAWGVTSGHPRIVPQSEIDGLLPLVNDGDVQVAGNHVALLREGMGLDLGGIAKGAACDIAKALYEENGVESAVLNIGGNVYGHGRRPDGQPFKVGFRNHEGDQTSYIATFGLENAVVAVSASYERNFEVDGQVFSHVIDPQTGKPLETDIVSVGVIHADGATADFWSTTLYVWGVERTLRFMREEAKAEGVSVILLAEDRQLYVSDTVLNFELYSEFADSYEVEFITGT